MARNSDQLALIVRKLTEQRSATEQNASDVGSLVDEKLAGYNAFTAEQIELVKSIISQAIAEERKMGDTLTNTLKSLKSSLDAQNGKTMESHVAMLDMVSHGSSWIESFLFMVAQMFIADQRSTRFDRKFFH